MMTGKLSKKGKNPGVVDNWLDNLNLYRKNVAYDETCLFRAVSEQLFDCQVFHERVRRECIEYGRKSYEQFKHLTNSEDDWHSHLNMLEKHMVICGNLEINIISRKYNRDVLIFHANKQQIYDVTKYCLPSKPIMLCLMDDDHYDAVYQKEHIADAGFCQSIIYKILYEDVFQIPKVDSIVNAMLYEKTHVVNQLELEERKVSLDGQELNLEDLEHAVIAPFPFKVAKALDPTIYRNIEYDSWGEVRRELRLGDWYYGDDKLKLGTRCVYKDSKTSDSFDCYIQEILQDQEKCVVYLIKFAQKKVVNYSDLAPENDAKPWPLPYRFSKHLVINTTPQLPPIEKIKNNRKKNKEKKQNKSLSEVSNIENDGIDNVSAFVGVPLQMHNNLNNNNEDIKNQNAPDSNISVTLTENLSSPVTPDINNYPQRYQWEQVQWPTSIHYVPPENIYYPQTTTEPFVWPQGSTTPYYDHKTVVSSAPATPNIIPYQDSSYPLYFNYPVDQYPQYPLTPTTPTSSMNQNTQLTPEGSVETAQQCQQGANDGACIQNNQAPRQNITYTSQPPQSLEMYSQVVSLPPGTPVIYTIPTDLDMVVPTSPVTVYTPATPVDMQYVPSPGYVYSPGQNVSSVPWFHHGYSFNSQGFIFPQSHSQTK